MSIINETNQLGLVVPNNSILAINRTVKRIALVALGILAGSASAGVAILVLGSKSISLISLCAIVGGLTAIYRVSQKIQQEREKIRNAQTIPVPVYEPKHYLTSQFNATPWLSPIDLKSIHAKNGLDKKELDQRNRFIDCIDFIQKEYAKVMDAHTLAAFRQHRIFLKLLATPLSPNHLSIYRLIEAIAKEIFLRDTYTASEIKECLKLLAKMTAPGIRAETIQNYLQLYVYRHRSQLLTDKEQNKCTDHVQFLEEKGRRVVKVRLDTKGEGKFQCEQTAYDFEHILGNLSVPPSITLRSGIVVQQYVSQSIALQDFLLTRKDGAKILSSLDTASIHSYVTLAILRGRRDGHSYNTVVSEANSEILLKDIDEEADFQLSNHELTAGSAEEGKISGGVPVLGLPQAGKPYSRLMLLLFSWEGIKKKIVPLFEQRGLTAHIAALEERLDRMIEICRYEPQQDEPQFTPRDLYFAIYGKDYLYQTYKRFGYTDLEFFDGGHEGYDHYAPTRPPDRQDSVYDQNLLELNLKFEAQFLIEKDGDDIPGDSIIKRIANTLPPIQVMEVTLKAFDHTGWERYKKGCISERRRPKSFMLAHFLRGIAKRIARQISYRYPSHLLEVEAGEHGKQFLVLKNTI